MRDTSSWPFPAQLSRSLPGKLPGALDSGEYPNVAVHARDEVEKRCPLWRADHYELAVYYYSFSAPLLPLWLALERMPEVYQLTYAGIGRELDPAWPVRYRERNDSFRPQVRALWRPVNI
jgi:hypothetical protein